MAELKLIKEDTDLSILHPLDWDAVLNGKEYQVYRAEGYVHTIGGRWGENDYWASANGTNLRCAPDAAVSSPVMGNRSTA